VASEPDTLRFYRRAIALRRDLRDDLPRVVEWLDLGEDVLAFSRGDLRVVLNTGRSAVPLPPGEVLLASGDVTSDLPPGTAAWLRA